MITNSKDFFNYLSTIAESAKSVDVCTYGAYLGFSKGKDWHSLFPVEARSFIDKCPSNTRILIGYTEYEPPDCITCPIWMKVKSNKKNSTKLMLSSIKNVQFRVLKNCHVKIYRIDNRIWIGSMNMGVGPSRELIIELDSQKLEVKKYFNTLWEEGKEVV